MAVIHSDCAGSMGLTQNYDWAAKRGMCPSCGKEARIFKDREGFVVMYPHTGPEQ